LSVSLRRPSRRSPNGAADLEGQSQVPSKSGASPLLRTAIEFSAPTRSEQLEPFETILSVDCAGAGREPPR
jgi:hypothetical protein